MLTFVYLISKFLIRRQSVYSNYCSYTLVSKRKLLVASALIENQWFPSDTDYTTVRRHFVAFAKGILCFLTSCSHSIVCGNRTRFPCLKGTVLNHLLTRREHRISVTLRSLLTENQVTTLQVQCDVVAPTFIYRPLGAT